MLTKLIHVNDEVEPNVCISVKHGIFYTVLTYLVHADEAIKTSFPMPPFLSSLE